MDFNITITITIAMAGVALLLSAWLGLRLRVANKRVDMCTGELQVLRADNLALRADVAALTSHAEQLERQLQHLSRRQNQIELRDPITQTYEPAIRMVRKGADVEELISTCGLGRSEAELIMMLHSNVIAPETVRSLSERDEAFGLA